MKKASRIFALVMALAMVFGLSAFASGEMSAEPAASAAESTADMTVSSYATLNNFNRNDEGYIYVGYDVVNGELTDESNWEADSTDFVLDNDVEGAAFTAVHASGEGSNVTVTGTLTLTDPADDSEGVHASDFSGTGVAIVAANNATVEMNDLDVVTDGFVRAALIIDNYCTAWVKDSSFVTYGADPLTEAWDGYYNSANTGMMLSPPWVLGIQGGIRTINVLDNQCTLIIENSYLASGGWGVISTDGCTSPFIYVIDSQLETFSESEGGMCSGWELYGYDADAYGSGYGAYIIGVCEEHYYGSDVSGATFGAIAREGTVDYASSNGEIALTSATGEDLGTVKGAGNVSTINCVFGCQVHSAEDTGVSYLDGTIVNAEEAVFLYRSSGHSTFVADNAELNSASGIILQMMDDDDSTVGGFSPFNEFLYEDAGMPSASGNETGATENNAEATITLTNGDYTGDFYNGTGYYGQAGDVMNVNIGEGAAVNGTISLTETFHGMEYSAKAVAAADAIGDDVAYVLITADGQITENEAEAAYIQFTQFSLRQYYMLCHVENHIYNNGYSGANVVVSDGGVWTVAGEGIINYLKVDGGTVYGEITENADGSLTIAPSDKAIADGEYGTLVEANVAVSSGMGNAGASGEASGSASGESSDEAATEAGGDWDAYIAYLDELVDSDPTVDIYQQLKTELTEAQEADYTGMEDGTMYGAIANLFGAVSYEEFVG